MLVRSNIHYLIDVDCLFTDSNTYPELIADLKERGVTSVTLLDDRDENKAFKTEALYIDLIEDIEAQGILVDHVLTSADLFFRDAFDSSDFHPGDAYQKFISPLELCVLKLKGIAKQFVDEYREFYAEKSMLNTMRFLRDQHFIDGDTNVSSLQNDASRSTIVKDIELYILVLEKHTKGGGDIDYKMIIHDVSYFFNADEKNDEADITLNELIAKYELLDAKLSKTLPVLSHTNVQRIENYLSAFKKYSNQIYYSHLVLRHRDEEKKRETSLEESESEEGESNPQRRKYTKGDIYAWYVADNLLNKSDLVIFMNATREGHNLVTIHSDYEFKNKLAPMLPPVVNQSGSKYRPSHFRDDIDRILNQHMRKSLRRHVTDKLQGGCKTNDISMKQYVADLCSSGMMASEKNDHQRAAGFFMMAYLFYDDHLESVGETIDKKAIIKLITTANKKMDTKLSAPAILLPFIKIITAGGFEMQMKIIRLNLLLHRENHPDCYRNNNLSLLAKTMSSLFDSRQINDQVDIDFTNEIVRVVNVAKQYPPHREFCISFLDTLRDQMALESYKQCIQRKIVAICNMIKKSAQLDERIRVLGA